MVTVANASWIGVRPLLARRVRDNQCMSALEQRVPDASIGEVGRRVIDEVEAGKGRIKARRLSAYGASRRA